MKQTVITIASTPTRAIYSVEGPFSLHLRGTSYSIPLDARAAALISALDVVPLRRLLYKRFGAKHAGLKLPIRVCTESAELIEAADYVASFEKADKNFDELMLALHRRLKQFDVTWQLVEQSAIEHLQQWADSVRELPTTSNQN